LTISGTGPITSAVSVTPNPNNGAKPLSTSQPVVRVSATMASTLSQVVAAEGFIDDNTAADTTRGFPLVPSDGAWGGVSETGYADIPLSRIAQLASGDHQIYVRGKDAVGKWGAMASGTLTIDTTAPTFTGITVAPPVINAVTPNLLTVTVLNAADTSVGGPAAGVVGGEYWFDIPAPAPGNGQVFAGVTPSIDVAALANGSHTVGVRIRDAAGNWSANTASATFLIDRIAPSVTSINRSGTAAITNANTIQFLVTFSESVTGGTPGNFTLVSTGAATGTITSVSAGPGTTRTVTVSTGSGAGTLRLDLASSAGLADPADNPVAPLPYSAGQVVTIDKTRPTVTITRTGPAATNAATVQFSVVFSEPVTGFSAADFALAETLAGNTTLTLVGAGSTFTVNVTTGTGNGTLGLNMPGTATVRDLAGNTLLVPVTGPVYTIDRSAPTFTGLVLAPTTITLGTASVSATPTGTADIGGSGVIGGEWWIGNANIPAGTGTAFTGLTATVNTGALAAGTYTVRVRIRDAAGNWSAGGVGAGGVRIATLYVLQAQPDARTITANGATNVQISNGGGASVLANDLPNGVPGRTAVLASGPTRVSGTGTGTIAVACAATSAPGVCADGTFQVRLTPSGASGAARAASKRGTYQFSYVERLNGVDSLPATVTITVN
jgi:hypothetical protein